MTRRKRWFEILEDERLDTPRDWQPLVEVPASEFRKQHPELVRAVMRRYSLDEAGAVAWLNETDARFRHYQNDTYQVMAEPIGVEGRMLHIVIRRLDDGVVKDWRHFQEIKNQLAGPEREAVEIYPAESRKCDTSNRWHLWVFPEGASLNLGFPERDVSYKENRDVPGARQRPL